MRNLNNNGNSDRPPKRELFGTNSSPYLFNTKKLSIQQPIIITMVMNVNPLMVIVHVNVLCIQLLKYHDNDDPIIHIQQQSKVCVTNGEDINDHKLQYFPNSLTGRVVD
jgi:hypothetical protein